jgi:hypothetical protein
MQFIAINVRNTNGFTPEVVAEHIPLEVGRVRELYADSFVRQIWHRDDVPGGVLLVEAADEEDARSRLVSLPMVRAGIVEIAQLIPLKPFGGFGPPAG